MAWQPNSFEPDTTWTPGSFTPESPQTPPAAMPPRRPIPGVQALSSLMVPAGGIAGGIGGGALGALTGNPLAAYLMAIAGAGAGGAAMEGSREALLGQPLNAAQIARSGAGQSAGEAIGIPSGWLVGRAASGLMRSALKPGKAVQQAAMRAKSIRLGRRVAPAEASLADQALKEGVGVTQGGLKKVRGEIGAAAGRLNESLASADATGKTFNVGDALSDIGRLRSKVGMQTDAGEALIDLQRQIRSFIKSKSAKPVRASSVLGPSGAPARAQGKGEMIEVPPSTFNEWKRTWQGAADAIYGAEQRGASVAPRQQMKARLNQNVARSARKSLEQFPGVAPANQRIAELSPLERAVLESLYRNTGHTVGAIPPAVSWAVPGFLRSAENISRLALLANSPMVKGVGRYGPHVAAGTLFGGAPEEELDSGSLPDSLRSQ